MADRPSTVAAFNARSVGADRLRRWKSRAARRHWLSVDRGPIDAAFDDVYDEGFLSSRKLDAYELPFFCDTYLLDAVSTLANEVPPRLRALWNTRLSEFRILDESNDPVYDAVLQFGLKEDDASLLEYIRFFFAAVVGRSGSFLIAERTDDFPWSDGVGTAELERVARLLEPLEVVERRDAELIAQSTVLFKNALFRSRVRVALDDGHVEQDGETVQLERGRLALFDEELLLEDLSVLTE